MTVQPWATSDDADFSEMLDRLVHRICRDAVWAGNACTWLGWTMRPARQGLCNVFATLDIDLYSGTAGIALFLARYLESRPSLQVATVLRGAIEHALVGLGRLPSSQTGLFDGAAGVCLAAIEAGVALADEPLRQRGLEQLLAISAQETGPTSLDVINGSAGLIQVQLAVADRFRRDELLDSAIRQGDLLLALADRSEDGWSWSTMPGFAQRNLTGYSHGAAGIATALLELHHQTGDTRFLEAARAGWRYERTHFCLDRNNWPDFRLDEDEVAEAQPVPPQFVTAWCHGAVGIGLSRLRAWELGYDDAELSEEIRAALASTQIWLETHTDPRTDFSLCHGRAGNAELFVAAAEILKQPELHDVAATVGRCGIRQFECQGRPWACGGTKVGETPSLMFGLAGIGMFYLRLLEAGQIDTPLLIRPARWEPATR